MFELLTALIVLFAAAYGCTFTIFIHSLHLKKYLENKYEAYLKYGFLVVLGIFELAVLSSSVNFMLALIAR